MNSLEVHDGYITIANESFIFSIEDTAVSQVAPVVIHDDTLSHSVIAFVDQNRDGYSIKIYKAVSARNHLERVAIVNGFTSTWHASTHLFSNAKKYLHH